MYVWSNWKYIWMQDMSAEFQKLALKWKTLNVKIKKARGCLLLDSMLIGNISNCDCLDDNIIETLYYMYGLYWNDSSTCMYVWMIEEISFSSVTNRTKHFVGEGDRCWFDSMLNSGYFWPLVCSSLLFDPPPCCNPLPQSCLVLPNIADNAFSFPYLFPFLLFFSFFAFCFSISQSSLRRIFIEGVGGPIIKN